MGPTSFILDLVVPDISRDLPKNIALGKARIEVAILRGTKPTATICHGSATTVIEAQIVE
jgi:hypothetical protein